MTFVVPHALPAIDATINGGIGGMETRAWTLARSLAREFGYTVNFATSQRPRSPASHGVNLIHLDEPLEAIREHVSRHVEILHRWPFLQFKRWSPHLLWELPALALSRPFRSTSDDALSATSSFCQLPGQILAGFGVNRQAALTIAAAQETGRPSVLFLASDSDLDPRFASDSNFVNSFRCHSRTACKLLKTATLIIAQTPRQQQLLRAHFQRESVVVGNPIDIEEWDRLATQPLPAELAAFAETGYALWIGRADDIYKRATSCLNAALRLPQFPFLMVLNPGDAAVEQKIRRLRPKNLTVAPRVAFDRIPAVFQHARLLINTSSVEGFPNTFLQAAVSRVPICSLEFGAEFLARHRAGMHCGNDFENFLVQINSLWHRNRSEFAESVRSSVLAVHDSRLITAKVVKLIEGLTSQSPSIRTVWFP